MEALVLLILFFVFGISYLIALKIYLKFSANAHRLLGILLLGILPGIGSLYLAINYWHLSRLNTLKVPFTTVSGNELKFNFIPQYSGEYSIDITYLNKKMKKQYDSCDEIISIVNQTTRRSENDCNKEIIYRTINADINHHSFIKQLQYLDSDVIWGNYNQSLNESALHIYEFHGVENKIVPVKIKINASQEEILSAKPVIVIGPLDDALIDSAIFTYSGKVMIFIAFALPFVLFIMLLFKDILSNLIKHLIDKLRSVQ